MILRRILAWLALLVGFLGVVACGAAAYGVWCLDQSLHHVNNQAFETLDTSLTAVRARVLRAQQRVAETKPVMEEITQRFRTWTKEHATETIALRREAGAKAEKLAGWMQQADQGLETAEATLRGTRQVLKMARSLDAPADSALADEGLEKLAMARRLLQQSMEAVDGIRTFMGGAEEGKPFEERLAQVAPLAARVLAMILDLDTRLGELAQRMADMQSQATSLHDRTDTFIFRLTLVCFVFVAWMAAGQAALIYWGWKHCRRCAA